jgi:hypothetical protein
MLAFIINRDSSYLNAHFQGTNISISEMFTFPEAGNGIVIPGSRIGKHKQQQRAQLIRTATATNFAPDRHFVPL